MAKKIFVMILLSLLVLVLFSYSHAQDKIEIEISDSTGKYQSIQTEEEIADVADSIRNRNVIEFTEEEALIIRGRIPHPKALVSIPREVDENIGESFAPDMEKLIDEIINIKKKQ